MQGFLVCFTTAFSLLILHRNLASTRVKITPCNLCPACDTSSSFQERASPIPSKSTNQDIKITSQIQSLASSLSLDDLWTISTLKNEFNDWLRRPDTVMWSLSVAPLKDFTKLLPAVWRKLLGMGSLIPDPSRPPVVIDVGAARYNDVSDDSETLLVHKSFGSFPVVTIGVDAAPGKVNELLAIAKSHGINMDRFFVDSRAIFRSTGEATLYAKGSAADMNLYSLLPPGNPVTRVKTISMVDLLEGNDRIRSFLGPNPLFYVKVDTEGGEYAVLDGMEAVLRERRVLIAAFEYALFWGEEFAVLRDEAAKDIYKPIGDVSHPTLREFQMRFWDFGYILFVIGNNNMVPVSGIWWDSNFEFCLEPRKILRRTWCVSDVVAIRKDPSLLRIVLSAFKVQYDVEKAVEIFMKTSP